jgi:hypothetical protein
MLIPDERVAEVVAHLTDMPKGLDSLDTVESAMELEAEFGVETVRLAVLYIEASRACQSKQPLASCSSEAHLLWDREFDR